VTVTARTIFFGTGPFAVPVLDTLVADRRIDLAAVVTAPPLPSGRGRAVRPSPVGSRAAVLGIGTLTPERLRDPAVTSALEELRPDLVVLADYGRLVPRAILELPRHGALNLHPSLLPRHRGATPIQAAILAGDEATGVTLMRMDAGLDTGPILAQVSVSLSGDETAGELDERLAALAGRLLADSLDELLNGALPAMPQPTDGVTLTRPLRREDGVLDPGRPAVELERQVRAYQPWPGAWLETVAGRLGVRRARAIAAAAEDSPPVEDAAPGLLRAVDGAPQLTTADGRLELVEVLPAGGRVMSGAALLRGRPALAGSRVPVGRVR
jgi:methionyl-tRNA formyltransferase